MEDGYGKLSPDPGTLIQKSFVYMTLLWEILISLKSKVKMKKEKTQNVGTESTL